MPTDRVLIAELLLMHPGVRDVLRDPGGLHEMRTMLAEGRAQFGTQTFDQHLADLVIDGRVAFEDYVQVSAAPRTSRIA